MRQIAQLAKLDAAIAAASGAEAIVAGSAVVRLAKLEAAIMLGAGAPIHAAQAAEESMGDLVRAIKSNLDAIDGALGPRSLRAMQAATEVLTGARPK